MAATFAASLVANGSLPTIPGVWLVPIVMAVGIAPAAGARLIPAAETLLMTVFSRYLMRNVFIGFAAAAGLLIRCSPLPLR